MALTYRSLTPADAAEASTVADDALDALAPTIARRLGQRAGDARYAETLRDVALQAALLALLKVRDEFAA